MSTRIPLTINQGASAGLYLLWELPDNTNGYTQGYVYGISPFKFLLVIASDYNKPMVTSMIAIDETLIDRNQKILSITNGVKRSYRNVRMTNKNTLYIANSSNGSTSAVPYRIYGIR